MLPDLGLLPADDYSSVAHARRYARQAAAADPAMLHARNDPHAGVHGYSFYAHVRVCMTCVRLHSIRSCLLRVHRAASALPFGAA